ncbi:MAG: heme o synthase [Planctomycetaceae bacterium]
MSSQGPTPQFAHGTCTATEEFAISQRSAAVARFYDYLELTKPRIAILALVTVTVGYLLSSAGEWQLEPLLHALAGISLVAAGSSALNQFIERHIDARMHRTAQRPLPSGRLQPAEALWFGIGTGVVGTVYLAVAVNVLTAVLAASTLALYVLAYTPLKQLTSLSTAIGAIPGALPPVLGWTAAGGSLDAGAFSLFAILFLWQFPHFLAICWLYREEYANAGLRMLPAVNPRPRVTGYLAVVYALALIPASFLPTRVVLAGDAYLLIAAVLGLAYLASAIRFCRNETRSSARGLLWTSLVYLPVLLMSLTWNHFQLLQ